MNQPAEPPLPPEQKLGFIKQSLIFLSGADPRTFRHLPPSEASEYSKLGFLVIIPFILALTAGSFTVYTIQETKSFPMALLFGVVWAIMILAIDVGVMSQLVRKDIDDEAPRRDYYGYQEETQPATEPGREKRRVVLAFVRIMIAATLGAVMSHCLVLAIFKGRVQSQMESERRHLRSKVESEFLPAINKLESDLNAMNRVSAYTDQDQFLAAYHRFLDPSEKMLPRTDLKEQFSGLPEASKSEDLKGRFANVASKLEQSKNELALRKKKIQSLSLELLRAKKMLGEERVGDNTRYQWLMSPFAGEMPETTSGEGGNGTQAKTMGILIKSAAAEVKRMEGEIKKRQALVSATEAEFTTVSKEKDQAEQSLREALSAKQLAQYEEGRTARMNNEKQARQTLDRKVAVLTTELEERQLQYKVSRSSLVGESYDLLEQTEALHNLVTGADGGSKKLTILALILLILICLMFIDLTPMIMKLMKPPGAYERWIKREADHFAKQQQVSYAPQPAMPQATHPPQGYSRTPSGNPGNHPTRGNHRPGPPPPPPGP